MRYIDKVIMEGYDSDAEIFIADESGTLHDFNVQHRAAVFDGFDTAYEEGLDLILID